LSLRANERDGGSVGTIANVSSDTYLAKEHFPGDFAEKECEEGWPESPEKIPFRAARARETREKKRVYWRTRETLLSFADS